MTNIFGQNLDVPKYRFANEIFKSEKYQKKNYEKYSKKINVIENGTYNFGDKFLKVSLEDNTYEKIFSLGIFNPDIIFGEETLTKPKAELDTLTQNQKVFYNLTRNDSLSICCFEELDKLNPNYRTKRFKFWLFRIGIANPTEYYIEFYNEKAIKETTITEFIENAKMTFYYKGTLII
ncbi:MAG: hypothetical protein EOO87_05345 [Pedobacter sp.]|nr:MAG: hypothetical protein EOO87_05345 [Pedobacter sp.]